MHSGTAVAVERAADAAISFHPVLVSFSWDQVWVLSAAWERLRWNHSGIQLLRIPLFHDPWQEQEWIGDPGEGCRRRQEDSGEMMGELVIQVADSETGTWFHRSLICDVVLADGAVKMRDAVSDGVMILSVSTGIHCRPSHDPDSGNRSLCGHLLWCNFAAVAVAAVLVCQPLADRDTVAAALLLPLRSTVCWGRHLMQLSMSWHH